MPDSVKIPGTSDELVNNPWLMLSPSSIDGVQAFTVLLLPWRVPAGACLGREAR